MPHHAVAANLRATLLTALFTAAALTGPAAQAQPTDTWATLAPLLAERCVMCHNASAAAGDTAQRGGAALRVFPCVFPRVPPKPPAPGGAYICWDMSAVTRPHA